MPSDPASEKGRAGDTQRDPQHHADGEDDGRVGNDKAERQRDEGRSDNLPDKHLCLLFRGGAGPFVVGMFASSRATSGADGNVSERDRAVQDREDGAGRHAIDSPQESADA